MIRCENVNKSFGSKKVLSGIDIEIGRGQIFGLLGPSGAGKTTLIKILTGQLSYDKGEVEILDKRVEELTGNDRKSIGIMMEQFGVYDRLTCADNLKIYADIYGVPRSRVKEMLKYVGLEEAENRAVSKLSKGMEARLRLARVLMSDPKIIFLDEPTSGLDPKTMRAIHKLILQKKNEGCTIFLTTHNMEEAAALCDNVALLNEGKIVEMGKPSEICRKYNYKKRILMHLANGEDIELVHGAESAKDIYDRLLAGEIEAIHSSEPNLETVFLEITGKQLEEV